MRQGMMVKIPDIGPLATVVRESGQMVELELEGERFWMPEDLVYTIDEA